MDHAVDVLTHALGAVHEQLSSSNIPHRWPPPPAPGWAHLPIILVDLVFNLSRNYDKVARPAIRGYADYVSRELDWTGGRDALMTAYADVGRTGHRAHTLDEALGLLEPLTAAERKEILACGDVPAWWSATAPRRADTILDAMSPSARSERPRRRTSRSSGALISALSVAPSSACPG